MEVRIRSSSSTSSTLWAMAPLSPQVGDIAATRQKLSVEQHFAARHSGTVEPWALSSKAFLRSLASDALATRQAYRGDVEAFVAWADRAGVCDPAEVDRLMLRRYLAYLADTPVLPADHRPQGGRSAVLLRLAAPPRAHSGRPVPAPVCPVGRGPPSPRARRQRARSAARAVASRGPERAEPGDHARETTPCWSSSTAAACGWRSSAGSGLATSISRTGPVTVWGKGGKQRRVPMSCRGRRSAHRLPRLRASGARQSLEPDRRRSSSTARADR